ncbi:multisubunit sodium/proton antiporter, MrpD subunit (TC 2.A.63.1) [Haloplanus vescus]|uniref:Multisubunit sodium/proton antiporter, MrpD subunit (TC 2.A.63.1) n=1 Tax=Haloplanus vescus TaxID=555874 RepID=A0A1H3W486_9EURY|nr:Na(+)/H(+) antiporter subunit D [Haloplanus vescus]SDZ81172.1 multisubunit sodium/proton antiporter, MrpD subunit (TC 2.A.63.1) [Haloplanus vescus]
MAGPLTALPPGILVLAAAMATGLAGRRLGHLLGALTTALVTVWIWVAPAGTHLSGQLFGFDAVFFMVDPFSRVVGLVFAFIATVAVTYSWATEANNHQTAYALTYVGSSLGAVFAGDWLTMAVWLEAMAVTSTILVWHYGGKAIRAGFRYALLHGIGGSLVLAAVAWHYVEVGSFLLSAAPGGMAGTIPQVLMAIGIGVNVGFIGLHAWLPDTYPRPHIAASVFLCVYTTKTGVYVMYRAFPEGNLWVAYMGGAMAVFGAGAALLQNDMRRLLSYHIQSQVGYMVAGVGIGTALATAGAFGHVFNHILYKSLLFMTAGAVVYQTGEENLKHLGGLARKMPVTAAAFTIAALAIAGFPGFNGFVSKGMVIGAAHHEHLDALWYLLLLGGVGTFLSFIKFGYYAFLHGPYEGEASVSQAPRIQQVAMGSVAVLLVFFGVVPDALFAILPLEGAYEFHTFTLGHVGEGLALAAAGVVGFVVLKKPLSKVGRVPDIDAVYNPLAFYGTRAVVHAVTETYAAVDRAVVGVVERAIAFRADPTELSRLRANIGSSIFILMVVLAGVLAWLGVV